MHSFVQLDKLERSLVDNGFLPLLFEICASSEHTPHFQVYPLDSVLATISKNTKLQTSFFVRTEPAKSPLIDKVFELFGFKVAKLFREIKKAKSLSEAP